MAVPPPKNDDVAQQKQQLRKQMGASRVTAGISTLKHRCLLARLKDVILQIGEADIAGVWPLQHEIDLRPLLLELRDSGYRVGIPETPPAGQPLVFRQWTRQSRELEGRYGTRFPDGTVLNPKVVLVPMLAFDKSFFRLGYGGGYYDRTLATVDVTSVGFAWSWQEVDSVPIDQYDYQMDFIVSERETRERFKNRFKIEG